METDKRYLQAETGANRDDGCTAVTAVLMDHTLVVAHVGDSRAVLSRGGKGAHLFLRQFLVPLAQTMHSACAHPLPAEQPHFSAKSSFHSD